MTDNKQQTLSEIVQISRQYQRSIRVDTDIGRVDALSREGANKRGNSSRLTQSFHFFMFEPIFSPVNASNQPI